jgi:hypothetical protein
MYGGVNIVLIVLLAARGILFAQLQFIKINFMKKKSILSIVAGVLLSINLHAQAVSKDSINILKQQKEALKIGKKLNERKLDLAKLENSVEKKTLEVQNTAQQAQISADNNDRAASILSNNALDEKLAAKAKNKAGDAKKNAKKAAKAAKKLSATEKNIEDLKRKISEDEAKLAKLPSVPMPGN